MRLTESDPSVHFVFVFSNRRICSQRLAAKSLGSQRSLRKITKRLSRSDQSIASNSRAMNSRTLRTMRAKVPVNSFYCVSVADSPSRIFTFSSRCFSVTHLACKRFNCAQISRKTAQLAMCLWPPAKISASCFETDARSSCW